MPFYSYNSAAHSPGHTLNFVIVQNCFRLEIINWYIQYSLLFNYSSHSFQFIHSSFSLPILLNFSFDPQYSSFLKPSISLSILLFRRRLPILPLLLIHLRFHSISFQPLFVLTQEHILFLKTLRSGFLQNLNIFWFCFCFWPPGCRLLVPQPKMEPAPPAVGLQSLSLDCQGSSPEFAGSKHSYRGHNPYLM